MARTVFVFGAGASAHLGVPVMRDFIDTADELRARSEVSRTEFDLVFSLIQDRLPQLYAKSVVDLTNIESVFSLIEMGRLVGRLPATPPEQVSVASQAIRRVLAETVEESCLFSVEGREWKPSSPYLAVANYIEQARRDHDGSSVSLITFNYDLGLDFALHWSNMDIDYGLGEQLQPRNVPLLKLHGSLNWTACSECGQVRPVGLQRIFQLESNRQFLQRPAKLPLRATRCLNSIDNHCAGVPVSREPALVPPSWNKTEYAHQFGRVWQHAARELAEAQDIRVIGYSLPQSDAFFRDLLALGLAGSTRLKSFLVVDPLPDVATRFQTLLGPDARGRFQSDGRRFEDYASQVLKPSLRERILSAGQ